MISYFLIPFLVAFVVCVVVTYCIRLLARHFKIVSKPGGRHAESTATPLLGGVAVFLTFLCVTILYPDFVVTPVIGSIVIASALLVIAGVMDDMYALPWYVQLIIQGIAACIVVISGTKLFYVNNPFGGSLRLDSIVFSIPGNGAFSLFGAIFIVVWLILFINTFNWFDGLDGLAPSVGAIAFCVLGFLALSVHVNQAPTAILAAVAAGAMLGFLIWNFPPARIYLGGSSSAIGFLLGALAIFAGAKVATAFLVFTIPIIDALWVIGMRLRSHTSIFKGDRSHLHYRLLARGWSPKKILFVLLSITAIAGICAVFLVGFAKFLVLLIFVLSVLFGFVILERRIRKNP